LRFWQSLETYRVRRGVVFGGGGPLPPTLGLHQMPASLKRLLRDENGATAVEYGLIAALIAVVIIVGLTSVGGNLSTMFGNVATNVSNAK